MVATLTGAGALALAGGLIGALVQGGVSENDAAIYAEGVERGASLITVRTDDLRAEQADMILSRHASVDETSRTERSGTEEWRPVTDSLATDEPRDRMTGTASHALDHRGGTTIGTAHPLRDDLGTPRTPGVGEDPLRRS